MKHFFGLLLTTTTLAFSTQVAAQATLYANDGFTGESLRMTSRIPSLQRHKFNDRASSVVVVGNRWEVCEDDGFRGRCTVLRPGRYPALYDIGLEDGISSARMIAANERVADNRYAPLPGTTPAAVNITFFDDERFQGRSYTATGQVPNLRRTGFNERASSAVVSGERWEVCENNRYRGQCMVLRPGQYPSLAAMGLNDEITSVRVLPRNTRVSDNRYAPAPMPAYDGRRRNGERLYEADITSSRAVLATSGQRCWVESTQVPAERSGANIPGAVVGALLGGILGHQVGNGSGQDIATVGGVVAGGAIGAQFGRDGKPTTQDVQRCENVPGGAQPAYWDVTYNFRGTDHRIQTASAPGNRITVNERGEPREQDQQR
ncbi:beta/gamma crystallin-related protein [Hydrogenophaga sp.]|uniref:beta/gamma crystallin-related protein n=1 Tax=Hydrogenophaga sp. TaxID=1904254 RepID=UPI002FCC15AA